ncbi:hypothetical protein jhhlp_004278 [Lomentospora prolificans]|uniref:non-specific serine/threonine protein kinase n=1 Tax=Lomentospora prolificans TaxID=41688 RepID=A0A2N3NB51_9PEZI|nr:hypothetical protein jhhlp_004278 [Lomentospora prolificans]
MSLVPYHTREGREIVLQHRNALVVRDPSSRRLEIRGLAECPTCHRPLRSPSPERHYDLPVPGESYVSPNYFRMLRDTHSPSEQDRSPHNPSSPVRRLVHPPLPTDYDFRRTPSNHDFEEPPPPNEHSRIRREAFSPNYFNTFFVEEKELGRGGKGVVLLVRHEIDGCHLGHFACKRVPVGDDHAWLEKVLVEVELLAKLSHPNLVSYRHVWLENVTLNRFGPPVACAFILQQYCNSGDLLHHVLGDFPKESTKEELKAQMRRRSRGQADRPKQLYRRLSFEEIYSLFRDITSGLAYLHGASYIHRDLKPSNCLLHREGTHIVCLISDFGEVQPEGGVRKSTGATGTISWCAPEVLRPDTAGRYGDFTTKSDIFSLGMILYFMCFGRLPYANANAVHEELEDIDLLRTEIVDWEGFNDEQRERPDLPPELYGLLKRLLDLEPLNRPSAAEVLVAIKNEAALENRLPRGSNPLLSLESTRIQNLDSPQPPGTPRTERQKSPSRISTPGPNRPVLSPPGGLSSGQAGSGFSRAQTGQCSPRRRACIPRDQDDGSATSTKPPPAGNPGRMAGGSMSNPPLLLAPPMAFDDEPRRGLRATLIQRLYGISGDVIMRPTFLRLILFLVKMVTLSRSCLPYMFNLTLGLPLIFLAGLDLGISTTESVGAPSAFLTPGDPRAAHGRLGMRWMRGYSMSIALFGAHMLLIWALAGFGMLCPTPFPDPWLIR